MVELDAAGRDNSSSPEDRSSLGTDPTTTWSTPGSKPDASLALPLDSPSSLPGRGAGGGTGVTGAAASATPSPTASSPQRTFRQQRDYLTRLPTAQAERCRHVVEGVTRPQEQAHGPRPLGSW